MYNYRARYTEASEPLRRLDPEFKWDEREKQAFLTLKDLIGKQQLLAFYNVQQPVVLQCDTSTEGLGTTLFQEGCSALSLRW